MAEQLRYDPECKACQDAKGRMVITRDAHTCGICFPCELGVGHLVTLLGHTCGKELLEVTA